MLLKDSYSILVNFESLYGMWPSELVVSAWITRPKQCKDKFIFLASSNVSPTALLLDTFSDPAKSIKLNNPRFSASLVFWIISS